MDREQAREKLDRLLATYGADIARWPAEARGWFVHLPPAQRTELAARMAASLALQLDRLLDSVAPASAGDRLAAQIVAAARPMNIGPAGAAMPSLAPTVKFGWRSIASLTAVAIIGFALGWFDPVTIAGAAVDESASVFALSGENGEFDLSASSIWPGVGCRSRFWSPWV